MNSVTLKPRFFGKARDQTLSKGEALRDNPSHACAGHLYSVDLQFILVAEEGRSKAVERRLYV